MTASVHSLPVKAERGRRRYHLKGATLEVWREPRPTGDTFRFIVTEVETKRARGGAHFSLPKAQELLVQAFLRLLGHGPWDGEVLIPADPWRGL